MLEFYFGYLNQQIHSEIFAIDDYIQLDLFDFNLTFPPKKVVSLPIYKRYFIVCRFLRQSILNKIFSQTTENNSLF